MTRFAGDAFNAIRPLNGGLGELRRLRGELGEWAANTPMYTPEEERLMQIKKDTWSRTANNPVMNMNQKFVIGDSTLPESYDDAANLYRRAVAEVAVQLQQRGDIPPLVALAKAIQSVDPRQFTQGAPSQVAYLQRYAEASRNPVVRRMMDIPENGDDEWGVLLSPREAIQEYDRLSMGRGPEGSLNDLEPF